MPKMDYRYLTFTLPKIQYKRLYRAEIFNSVLINIFNDA